MALSQVGTRVVPEKQIKPRVGFSVARTALGGVMLSAAIAGLEQATASVAQAKTDDDAERAREREQQAYTGGTRGQVSP